jgi:hypothetical protein
MPVFSLSRWAYWAATISSTSTSASAGSPGRKYSRHHRPPHASSKRSRVEARASPR